MTTPDAARVAVARRWFRRQGYYATEADGLTIVGTPEHPDTWDANWVAAGPGVDGRAVMAALARHVGDAPWQVVQADCLTEPAVEAALALEGFEARSVLIEMTAQALASPHAVPAIDLRPVGAAEWKAFAQLVETDHREGRRTGELSPAAAAGLLDARRRRSGSCTYWLLVHGGKAVGYGMTAPCPNGLGLIENLFTKPAHRGRGLMSAFIIEAARRLRAAGCDAVFLDAHAHDTPKRLYRRLGFAPVALTRTWVRDSRAP